MKKYFFLIGVLFSVLSFSQEYSFNYSYGKKNGAQKVVPAIITQPDTSRITAGQNTTFSVTAIGTLLQYQWQRNDGTGWANLSNGGIFSGATTNTLTLTSPTAANDQDLYRCVVTGNKAPAATSNAAGLYFLTYNPLYEYASNSLYWFDYTDSTTMYTAAGAQPNRNAIFLTIRNKAFPAVDETKTPYYLTSSGGNEPQWNGACLNVTSTNNSLTAPVNIALARGARTFITVLDPDDALGVTKCVWGDPTVGSGDTYSPYAWLRLAGAYKWRDVANADLTFGKTAVLTKQIVTYIVSADNKVTMYFNGILVTALDLARLPYLNKFSPLIPSQAVNGLRHQDLILNTAIDTGAQRKRIETYLVQKSGGGITLSYTYGLDTSIFKTGGESALGIISGQSNAEGHAGTTYNLPFYYHNFVEYFNNIGNGTGGTWAKAFFPIRTPYGIANGKDMLPEYVYKMLPEIFAKYKKLYIIKYAKGATGLADFWLKSNNKGYDTLVNRYIIPALALLKNPKILFFYWNQGEADAASLTQSNAYAVNERQFFSDLRTDVPALARVKIISVIPYSKSVGGTYYTAYKETVRTAKISNITAISNYDTIDTKFYPISWYNSDSTHYNATGQKYIGDRVYLKTK